MDRGNIEVSTADGRTYQVRQGTASTTYVSKGVDVVPPAAPSGVTAVASSTSQIDVSWAQSTDNVGVSGYLVEWSGDSVNFKPIASVSGPPWSDTGLPPVTTLWYRVSAFDAQGNVSAPSPAASATTPDTTPPTVPTGLVAAPSDLGAISLGWAASSDDIGVAGYQVLRDGSLRAVVNGTTFLDTGLGTDELHRYAVASFDAAGNVSASSAIASAISACGVTIQSISYSSKYLTVKAVSTRGSGSSLAERIGFTSAPMAWSSTLKNWGLRKYIAVRHACVIVTASCGGVATKCF